MKSIISAVIVIIVLVFAVTGCADYQSASGQDANGTYNSDAAPAANAISLDQYQATTIGISCDDLVAEYGPPADKQVFDTDGYHDVTLMYNDVNDSGGFAIPQYMFDCINGYLDSKSNM